MDATGGRFRDSSMNKMCKKCILRNTIKEEGFGPDFTGILSNPGADSDGSSSGGQKT